MSLRDDTKTAVRETMGRVMMVNFAMAADYVVVLESANEHKMYPQHRIDHF